jgi:hypothetical protein
MLGASYLESKVISETLVAVGTGINMLKWILMSLTYVLLLAGIANKIRNVLSRSAPIE